ncbi:uncharacterized protein EKO05_0011380 [Ascochyta rabiei]|uniref:Uncharacterized protein n=1 Tax=Didymella rabiei TaxID=5454 RepID=A0A163KBF6_DIDRA|nr:uncharacterized protein EKO05_0011380 [Ascochyta rabiei]KZM26896.1 hypothetical protein ST47_g1994 [Ascochyta rabiei]UPX21185.1 hypothetical protein EKO05_0011380 [Ascochyta rabiei]
MPPKPSTVPAASKPAAAQADPDGLSLNKSAQGIQHTNAKRKRYREKRRRSNKSKHFSSGDAPATTTKPISETASASEVEPEETNSRAIPSSPSDTDTIATEPLPRSQYGRTTMPYSAALFVDVPVVAYFELRDLPSAGHDEGDHDQGLFATQKMERGTRIISERPLFTLPAPGDQLAELMAAYDNLSKSDRTRIWNLRPAAPEASEQLHNLRFLVDRLNSDLQNIFLKSEATRTHEEQTALDKMKPKLEHAMNVWRIAARWHANRCSMTDLPEEQRAHLPQGTPITGLFIERAQIRHSCVPNCFASYDANRGFMNVHVTRDIAAGEELTLSAFADNMYYKDAQDRSEELSAWGLTCDCEACDKKHPKFELHEAARRRAHTRVILLVDLLTRLEKADFTQDELSRTQDMAMALIRDLRATGCESVETVRWRNVLVDRVLSARALVIPENDRLLAWQIILGHVKECEKVGGICYGQDREEFRVLRRTREATQACVDTAIAYDEEHAPESILRSKGKGAEE